MNLPPNCMPDCLAVADCCRPAMHELATISNARLSFVADTVHLMESSNSEAVAANMLPFATKLVSIDSDGVMRSPSGR